MRYLRDLPAACCVALACAAAAAAPPRQAAAVECVSSGHGPRIECTVRLAARDGTPLEGARVVLGATMPSMPMAHSVAPRPAAPTGRPGEYRGALVLEMAGVWAVQADVSGPLRDRVVRTFQVYDCPADSPCPVAPASAPAGRGR